jgi:hypothetical protein
LLEQVMHRPKAALPKLVNTLDEPLHDLLPVLPAERQG